MNLILVILSNFFGNKIRCNMLSHLKVWRYPIKDKPDEELLLAICKPLISSKRSLSLMVQKNREKSDDLQDKPAKIRPKVFGSRANISGYMIMAMMVSMPERINPSGKVSICS